MREWSNPPRFFFAGDFLTTTHPSLDAVPHAERQFEGFENLMPFRVNDILLVSSLYDSFILREDGRLNELLIGESLELNLHQVPGITHVPAARRRWSWRAPSRAST